MANSLLGLLFHSKYACPFCGKKCKAHKLEKHVQKHSDLCEPLLDEEKRKKIVEAVRLGKFCCYTCLTLRYEMRNGNVVHCEAPVGGVGRKRTATGQFVRKHAAAAPAAAAPQVNPANAANVQMLSPASSNTSTATIQGQIVANASNNTIGPESRYADFSAVDIYLVGWDSDPAALDSVTEVNRLGSGALLLYARLIHRQLEAQRRSEIAIVDPEFLRLNGGTMVYYGAETPLELLVPYYHAGHWTLFALNVASKQLLHYDPNRLKKLPSVTATKNIRTSAKRLLAHAKEHLNNRLEVTDAVVLRGVADFGTNFHQNKPDDNNCGFFVLAFIEQFFKKELLSLFDIKLYRRYVGRLVNAAAGSTIQLLATPDYPPKTVSVELAATQFSQAIGISSPRTPRTTLIGHSTAPFYDNAGEHLPLAMLDYAEQAVMQIGVPVGEIGNDHITERGWLVMAPYLLYLRWVYEHLPDEQKEIVAFLSPDFFWADETDSRTMQTSRSSYLGFFGASQPRYLLAAQCLGSHWILYHMDLRTGIVCNYDPYRSTRIERCHAAASVKAAVLRLRTAARSTFQTNYNLVDTVQLRGNSEFGESQNQLRSDGINCGFYVLAYVEQIMRGRAFENFDVYQYRVHVANIVNPSSAPQLQITGAVMNFVDPEFCAPKELPLPSDLTMSPVRTSNQSPRHIQDSHNSRQNLYRDRQRLQTSTTAYAAKFSTPPQGTPRTGRPRLQLSPNSKQARQNKQKRNKAHNNRALYKKKREELIQKNQLSSVSKLMKTFAKKHAISAAPTILNYFAADKPKAIAKFCNLLTQYKYRVRKAAGRYDRNRYSRYLKTKNMLSLTTRINKTLASITSVTNFPEGKFEELKILVKLRSEKAPKSLQEAVGQLGAAKYLSDKLALMTAITTDALDKVRTQILNHISGDVVRLNSHSDNHYATRVLGRVRYHVCKTNESIEGYKPMKEVYVHMYDRFMEKERECAAEGATDANKPSNNGELPLVSTPSTMLNRLALNSPRAATILSPKTPISRKNQSSSNITPKLRRPIRMSKRFTDKTTLSESNKENIGPSDEFVPMNISPLVVDKSNSKSTSEIALIPHAIDSSANSVQILSMNSPSSANSVQILSMNSPSSADSVQILSTNSPTPGRNHNVRVGALESAEENDVIATDFVAAEVEDHDVPISHYSQNQRDALDNQAVEENDAVTEEVGGIRNAAVALLRSATYIRECSLACEPINDSESPIMKKLLLQLVDSLGKRTTEVLQNFHTPHPSLQRSPLEWLGRHYNCYSGIRTLKKRVADFERLHSLILRIGKALTTIDIDEMHRLTTGQNVTRSIWNAVCKEYFDHTSDQTLSNTYKNWGKAVNKFREDINKNEVHVCQVCNQLNMIDDMSSITICDGIPASNTAPVGLRQPTVQLPRVWLPVPLRQENEVRICRMCRRKVVEKKLPPYAIVNGNGVDEMPPCLEDMNWIELCLIQLIRPVQNIFHLVDQGGRTTGVKATKGAMVLLPVPLESTVDHLAETLELPSATGLRIMVDAGFTKKLISLSKVLTALKWLKENNKYYAQITINENFCFTDRDEVIFPTPQPQERYDALIARNPADNEHLLTQKDFEGQPLLSTSGVPAPNTTTSTMYHQEYVLKKHPYHPIQISKAQTADVKSFPHLFPTGNFGFEEPRESSLKLRAVFKSKLRNAERRFARNMQYVAMGTGIFAQLDITSSLGINARLGKGRLPVSELQRMIVEKDERFAQLTSPIMEKLRGTQPYWNGVKQELKAHIAIFGPPTFFITLNPSEENWTEIHEAYAAIYKKDVAEVKENIRHYIAEDSYVFSRCVQRRYRMFRKYFLGDGSDGFEGPLGKVAHYFCRIEYQKRGTEHLHLLIWNKDAPGKDATDEERITFIDKYITARMPDEATEKELFDIVKNNQMHWKTHSATCRRTIKHRGAFHTVCRFEFPRPATGRTVINTDTSMIRGTGLTSKPYSVARRRNDEQYVNDYNAALLLAWGANIDIQYVMSDVLDVVNYITGYTTKHETAKGASMYDRFQGTTVNSKDLFKIFIDLLGQRECGSMELADMIMGHPLYFFDAGHVFINTNCSEKRSRMLQPSKTLLKAPAQSSGYLDNMYDTYYPNRNPVLEQFCLFNIMVNYDVVSDQSTVRTRVRTTTNDQNNSDDGSDGDNTPINKPSIYRHDFHVHDTESPFYCHNNLPTGTAFSISGVSRKKFCKRTSQVPRIFWPNLLEDDDAVVEDFYRRLCIMFIPWRDEEKDLLLNEKYIDKWTEYMSSLEITGKLDVKADIELFIDRQNKRAEMDRLVKMRRGLQKAALAAEDIEVDVEEELVAFDRVVDENAHVTNVTGMNTAQQTIYDDVIGRIAQQEADKVRQIVDVTVQITEPITMFVTGTAGTGKSYLINTLADELTLKYTTRTTRAHRPAVLIAAPTGLASVQIKGSTIHSLFGIDVQKGKRNRQFEALQLNKLNLKRTLFQNVKLLIIDEISMCSNVLLTKIHMRLEQVFPGTGKPFGGRNLVSFGDLMQLPPVLASGVFKPLNAKDLIDVFNSVVPTLHLWSFFEYHELLENMRQRDDLAFAELMGRIRVGDATAEDHDMLMSRVVLKEDRNLTTAELAKFYVEKQQHDPLTMALFSHNETVREFNKAVISELNLAAVEIIAKDSATNLRQSKPTRARPYQQPQFSLFRRNKAAAANADVDRDEVEVENKTGGLLKKLLLAENARVMLRRNVDQSKGLVNGATGLLLRFIRNSDGEVDGLEINFDRGVGMETISRVTAIYDVGLDKKISRSQFPVLLSFAATIHKCQGLTLKTVIVGTAGIFAPAQAFVAMSRVTNISGLFLAEYSKVCVKICRDSLKEYNRLRETVNLAAFVVPATPRPRNASERRPNVTQVTSIVTRQTPSNRRQATVDPQDLDTQHTVSTISNASTSFSYAQDFSEDEGEDWGENGLNFLQLVNTGTDCFLIASCNILHAMSKVVRAFAQDFPDLTATQAPFLHRLREILLGRTNYVTELRRLLRPDFHTGMHVAGMALISMINDHFTEELKESFVFTLETTRTCSCNPMRQKQTRPNLVWLELSVTQYINRTVKWETLTTDFIGKTTTCRLCKRHMFTRNNISFDEEKFQYLMVEIHQDVLNHKHITGMNAKGMKFFNLKWRPIALIQHIPGVNHYIAWVRPSREMTSWAILDDDNDVSYQPNIPPGLKNITFICFERIRPDRIRTQRTPSR